MLYVYSLQFYPQLLKWFVRLTQLNLITEVNIYCLCLCVVVESEVEDSNLEAHIKRRVLHDLRKTTYHWTPLRYCCLLHLSGHQVVIAFSVCPLCWFVLYGYVFSLLLQV